MYKELSALELDDDIKNAVLDETTFKMTNLERVYQSTEGLDFMGFEFDDKDFSLIKKLPKEEFDKRMEKIAIDVVKGVVNSRKLNTDADKKKYFDKLIESKEFNTGIVLDAKYNEEYPKQDKSTIADEPETPLVTPRTRKSLTNLMPVNTYLESGNKRIDEIFYELKSLNLKKNPNAVSVLFRSYLDMIAYQFLKKMGGLEEIKTEDIFKLKNENDKKLIKVKSAFTKLNINIAEIPDEEFKKAIGINDSLDRKNMIPSLKFMLAHIASSTSLITDDKLR